MAQKLDAAALQPHRHSAVNQQQTVSGDNTVMKVEIRGVLVCCQFVLYLH